MPRLALKRTTTSVVRCKPIRYPDYIAPSQATDMGRAPTFYDVLVEVEKAVEAKGEIAVEKTGNEE